MIIKMSKPLLKCHKCGTVFHFQIPRGFVLRQILFFLPIKIYFCARCKKQRFLWITDQQANKYQKV